MLIKKKRKSLIIPKVSKFKKQFKGVLTSFETKKTATNIYYGTFGIKVLKNGRLRLKHVETLRKLILRYIKKYETL
jgi:ribosomal protein L16/L10AE